MAKKLTYLVGSLVRIKDPGKRPSNWNGDMMKLVGITSYICAADPVAAKESYRYRLTHWAWTWRHQDLELLELPKLDPNVAFRDKKHEF